MKNSPCFCGIGGGKSTPSSGVQPPQTDPSFENYRDSGGCCKSKQFLCLHYLSPPTPSPLQLLGIPPPLKSMLPRTSVIPNAQSLIPRHCGEGEKEGGREEAGIFMLTWALTTYWKNSHEEPWPSPWPLPHTVFLYPLNPLTWLGFLRVSKDDWL